MNKKFDDDQLQAMIPEIAKMDNPPKIYKATIIRYLLENGLSRKEVMDELNKKGLPTRFQYVYQIDVKMSKKKNRRRMSKSRDQEAK